MKITATTLGETGGDAVSMSMNLGYLLSTFIFTLIFVVVVILQIRSVRFHPALYWLTIIATTTVGTTLADFADRSLGIGYAGGSLLLLTLLTLSLVLWHRGFGSISVDRISSPAEQLYYWVTILFSQTLGTALGDWVADSAGLGYRGSAMVFGGLLVAIAFAYLVTDRSKTFFFWAAFILTRPFGAVLGDFLDKPVGSGGLAWSRFTASALLLSILIVCILCFPRQFEASAGD